MKNQDYDDSYDLFDNILKEVIEIVTGNNPQGMIRIPEYWITKLGYHNRLDLEEEFLYKVYEKGARITKIEFKATVDKMKNRIEIVREG